MIWSGRQFEFTFPRPVLVMGIVNVTPDSFWDGGSHATPEAAVAHALQLVEAGADLLDIGGESTRPGSMPVSEAVELERVMPVIRELAARVKIPLSIDTMKAGVARAALEAGAVIVNDVAAGRSNTEMWRLVSDAGAGYVCMHMQGAPATMQAGPQYADVMADVDAFFDGCLERLEAAGVSQNQVVLDPGIGFGKTPEHNLRLLAGLGRFTRFGRPLLVGVSRKSLIGAVTGAEVAGRLPGTLACECWAAQAGAQIIRTHDVAAARQALGMTEAILDQKACLR
jgi:dihydropteroate synthase